jgi:hypothetical protein
MIDTKGIRANKIIQSSMMTINNFANCFDTNILGDHQMLFLVGSPFQVQDRLQYMTERETRNTIFKPHLMTALFVQTNSELTFVKI